MSRIFWSLNESPAFRSFFHYYYVVGEAGRLMHPEQQMGIPYFYEAEVLAFDYKEYLTHGLQHLVRDHFPAMPSGN